jgi:hypothetical protein
MPNDLQIVHLAFNRVKELSLQYGDSIPHQAISEGFQFNGEKILLDNRAVGILKPRQIAQCAISIKTTMQRSPVNTPDKDKLAARFEVFLGH